MSQRQLVGFVLGEIRRLKCKGFADIQIPLEKELAINPQIPIPVNCKAPPGGYGRLHTMLLLCVSSLQITTDLLQPPTNLPVDFLVSIIDKGREFHHVLDAVISVRTVDNRDD